MKPLAILIAATLVQANVIELLGPGARPESRAQQSSRSDGTGQFLELAIFPSPGVGGFSRVQLWTSKREAGKYTRTKLNEKELQIPNPQRIATDLYEFPGLTPLKTTNAIAENRAVILAGTTDFTLRVLNTQALTVGRAIPLAASARNLAIRPASNEAWVTHAGTFNQLSFVDLQGERVSGTLSLRLIPEAVPFAVFFSNSGRTAYVLVRIADALTERGQILVFDAATRQLRSTISLGTTVPQSAAISPDGHSIYIAGTSLNDLNTAEPSLTYFDTFTGSVFIAKTGLSAVPAELLVHPNVTKLYWLVPQFIAIQEFDIASRELTRRVALPRPHTSSSIDITPMGDILFIRDSTGQQALHLDADTLETIDSQPIPAGPGAFLFRP